MERFPFKGTFPEVINRNMTVYLLLIRLLCFSDTFSWSYVTVAGAKCCIEPTSHARFNLFKIKLFSNVNIVPSSFLKNLTKFVYFEYLPLKIEYEY